MTTRRLTDATSLKFNAAAAVIQEMQGPQPKTAVERQATARLTISLTPAELQALHALRASLVAHNPRLKVSRLVRLGLLLLQEHPDQLLGLLDQVPDLESQRSRGGRRQAAAGG